MTHINQLSKTSIKGKSPMNKTEQRINIKQVRDIDRTVNTEHLAKCLDEVIADQSNSCCDLVGACSVSVNTLAYAGAIKQLVKDGASYA